MMMMRMEEEEKVMKELVELVEEEVEAPIEVVTSLWVGGIATLTLLSLIILQVKPFQTKKANIRFIVSYFKVLRTSHWCRGRKSIGRSTDL